MLATVFAIGAAGGVLSGMLGIGGAVVLLPLLTTFAGLSLKQASNITIVQVVASSLIGWLAYRRGQLVHLRLALFMGISSAVGGLVGGYASAHFTNRQLEWVFLGVVAIAIALLLIPVNELPQSDGSMPRFNPALAIGSGAVVGVLAGLLGAGGGFLIVPLMIAALRVPTRMAIGTSSAIKLISSVFAYAGKLLSSEIPVDLAAALVLAAVPCTYLGALLARQISPRWLRVLLGIVLAATAARGVALLIGAAERDLSAACGSRATRRGARRRDGDPATISAGAFRPDGVAREVDGGFRVTGRWPLGSGSSHATWYVAGCTVFRDDQPLVGPAGMPVMREVFFPAAVTEVIDTWESTGLRGTASHDYAVSDAFVPASHTVWFQDPPSCDRALYHMPPIAMFATFIGAVPLGIARHALDAFVALASAKTPTLSTNLLADKPVAQATFGRAHALVAAGRTYLIETLNDLWVRVQAGHAPSLADRGALWLAATHAGHSALEAIELLYSAAGASAVYHASPLDRCLRDARTAVQHVCTQVTNFELAGRQLLGRDAAPSVWGMDYRGEG